MWIENTCQPQDFTRLPIDGSPSSTPSLIRPSKPLFIDPRGGGDPQPHSRLLPLHFKTTFQFADCSAELPNCRLSLGTHVYKAQASESLS